MVAIIQEMGATRPPLCRNSQTVPRGGRTEKANDLHECTCAYARVVKKKLLFQSNTRLTEKLQKQ